MKRKNIRFFLLIAISFICLSFLSSCSVGFLGTYYFKIEGITYQTIHFDIFNTATLTTMVYENNELISKNRIKGKWERFTQAKKDSENNTIRDDNGNVVYNDSVYFTYYEANVKKSVQFHYEDDTLVDVFYNKEFETYREFRR